MNALRPLALVCLASALPAQDLELESTPTRWRLSYDEIGVPGGEDLGLLGVHYDLFAPDFDWGQFYAGLGGYGGLTGDAGGFFVGGLTGGWRRPLGADLSLDLGLFAGGGGGGGAPQGGGLMLRPHLALERSFGRLGLRAELAHVEFPNGELSDTVLSVGFTLDSALTTARTARDPHVRRADDSLSLDRVRMTAAAQVYRPTSESQKRISPDPYDDSLSLLGFQLAAELAPWLYLPLELWGAAGGDISGYAAVMSGLGFTGPLWGGALAWELELLAGMGGGGDVDTGGGLQLEAELGLRTRVAEHLALFASIGRLDAPGGNFEATTVEFGLSWDPRVANLKQRRGRGRVSGEGFELDGWQLTVHDKIYFPASEARKVDGSEYPGSLHLLGVGLEHALTDRVALTGRAYGAYIGDIGGYAEGLFGAVARFRPLAGSDALLEFGYEIGVGGGGGMDVGPGLIHQATAGASWPLGSSARLSVEGGYVDAVSGGSFEGLVGSVGVRLGVGRALAL